MPETILLPVGRVCKAHGIRGEVSVDYYANSPLLLRDGVYLRSGNGDAVFYQVASIRAHHGSLLVLFHNIADRNAAEALRGLDVLVPESRLPVPDAGEIYLYQVMGLTVLAVDPDAGDGGERVLGVISAVDDNGGQELWTIRKPGETDILFPATPEFVLSFDTKNGVVRVAPPPGLVSLYRS